MINQRFTFDQESNSLVLEYTNKLLAEFPEVIEEKFDECKGSLPKTCYVERVGDIGMNLVIPMSELEQRGATIKKVETSEFSANQMSIPSDIALTIAGLVSTITNTTRFQKIKSFEIIPLTNYPIESVKQDISEMIKAKRDLCFIKDYNDYLNLENNSGGDIMDLEQKIYKFKTNEFCDVVIDIMEAQDMVVIDEKYKNELKKVDWF